MNSLDNVNIDGHTVLISPETLKRDLPASDRAASTVAANRQSVRNILSRTDHRLLVVVGPCSIHDPEAALEYAARLRTLNETVGEHLLLVMRAYFEKPRTTVGWKGLINDPYLDDSFNIESGLRIARKLLLDISETGLALSTEALDPITPQYLQDLITWSAIGARTAESQTHREMASGLSSAVGFKNGTDGSLDVAINALKSVRNPHRFLGINPQGQVTIVSTRGNGAAHVVLRGGSAGPNYGPESVRTCERELAAAGVPENIMIDCSHANSEKDPARQGDVADAVAEQILDGNQSIMGLMLESNLAFGNQSLGSKPLAYGVSITDACIDWQTTETLLCGLAERLGDALVARRTAGNAEDAVA